MSGFFSKDNPPPLQQQAEDNPPGNVVVQEPTGVDGATSSFFGRGASPELQAFEEDAKQAAEAAEASAAAAGASAASAANSANTAASLATSVSLDVEAVVAAGNAAAQAGQAAQASATSAAGSAATATAQAANAATAATQASAAQTSASNSASAANTSATNAASSATNSSNSAALASTSASNAAGSASAAATSATAAGTSATNAANSATAAAGSATAAGTSATNAANSATSAGNSATAAATSATNAANSASAAAGSATNAATSAANAATSAANAATSETDAAASETAAANSATSAAGSASTATTKAAEAATSATNAAGSATNAANSASSAATSASNAATSAGAAATSATNAANSASAASTSASNAAGSATSASNSATAAAGSASAAASAQTAAEAARDSALAAYDQFDDRYLGVKASNPTVDNDGNALVAGALYFNSTAGEMRLYNGSAWVAAYVSGAGVLLIANNLSDLANAATARTNLGLATVAATGAYSDLTGIPSTFAPSAHTHTIAQVTGLQTALDGKLGLAGGALSGGLSAFGGIVAGNQTNATADSGFSILRPLDATPRTFAIVENDTQLRIGGGAWTRINIWAGNARPVLSADDAGAVTVQSSLTVNGRNVLSDIDGKLGVSANAVSASKLATARTISLAGDVTGSVSFDGSANASITATVADDSHNHIIGNVDGLQAALDGKQAALGYTPANRAGDTFTGNVGIGHSPSFALDINGNARSVIGNSYFCYTADYGMGTPDSNGLQIFTSNGDTIRFGHRTGGTTFTERMLLGTGGSVTAWVDLRAPIFYDSNNTAYYADLSSTGTAIFAAGGMQLYGQDGFRFTSASAVSAMRFGSAFTGESTAELAYNRATGATVLSQGNTGSALTQLFSINTTGLTLAGTTHYINTDKLLLQHNGTDGYIRAVNAGSDLYLGGSNQNTLTLHASNYAVIAGSTRSPIFYDSANTAFFVDPASTSNLTGLTVANTITGSISGNAATATTLQTARTINGVSFNGSADITVADATKLPLSGGTMTGAITFAAGQTWPTFNQSTTGNAATATALQTARTINGTSFNGSANITTANWGTARTLTVGSTGKSVDGSANVSWTLAEIGAMASGASATNSVDLRAPIFYDSNNTARYLDPTGSSFIQGNFYVARDGNSNDSFGGLEVRESSFQGAGTGAATEAPGINFHWGGRAAARLYMDAGGSFVLGGQSDITNNRRSLFLNELFAANSVRGTIFYDSNDTAYYVDPAGGTSASFAATVQFANTTQAKLNFFSTNYAIGIQNSTQYFRTGTRFSWFRNGVHSNGENDPGAGGVVAMTLDGSSNLTVTGNVTAYSDARLKKDVETIDGALDLVSKMRGVRYTRIDTENRNVGVIAQEMLEVLPEVVQQGVGDDDTLSVAYGNLVGVLIEAIKELKNEVETLKKELH